MERPPVAGWADKPWPKRIDWEKQGKAKAVFIDFLEKLGLTVAVLAGDRGGGWHP
jgi:hypothetical protein